MPLLFDNDDILYIILTVAYPVNPVKFVLLSRVCRRWNYVVTSILWKNPPGGALSPILSLLPEYKEPKARVFPMHQSVC